MNGGQRNGTNAQIWESKTIRIMMAAVPHVISGLGLRKFQADGFLLTRVYKLLPVCAFLLSHASKTAFESLWLTGSRRL